LSIQANPTTAAAETATSAISRQGDAAPASRPNAAPGFRTCTIESRPGITWMTSPRSSPPMIHTFVSRSRPTTTTAITIAASAVTTGQPPPSDSEHKAPDGPRAHPLSGASSSSGRTWRPVVAGPRRLGQKCPPPSEARHSRRCTPRRAAPRHLVERRGLGRCQRDPHAGLQRMPDRTGFSPLFERLRHLGANPPNALPALLELTVGPFGRTAGKSLRNTQSSGPRPGIERQISSAVNGMTGQRPARAPTAPHASLSARRAAPVSRRHCSRHGP